MSKSKKSARSARSARSSKATKAKAPVSKAAPKVLRLGAKADTPKAVISPTDLMAAFSAFLGQGLKIQAGKATVKAAPVETLEPKARTKAKAPAREPEERVISDWDLMLMRVLRDITSRGKGPQVRGEIVAHLTPKDREKVRQNAPCSSAMAKLQRWGLVKIAKDREGSLRYSLTDSGSRALRTGRVAA